MEQTVTSSAQCDHCQRRWDDLRDMYAFYVYMTHEHNAVCPGTALVVRPTPSGGRVSFSVGLFGV